MSVAEKLQTIAENEQKVYEAGQQSEYDRFWDDYQNNGTRKKYVYAFHMWTNDNFKPKYDIRPTGAANSIFREMSGVSSLPQRLNECGVILSTSNVTGLQDGFWNSSVEETGVLDLSNATELKYMFGYSKVKIIEKLILKASEYDSPYTQMFNNCADLETLIVEGVINKNSFDIRWSTKLTHESLMSIINALYDYSADTSGTTWTVTIGSTNIAKLTEEEQKIAREKGWNLA